MELDFSREWHIIGLGVEGPAAFAAQELAEAIGRMSGRVPAPGDGSELEPLIILDAGRGAGRREAGRREAGRRGAPRYSWRASPDRVEIYGEDGSALLRGSYDFLDSLGARWVAPGPGGERLPRGAVLALLESSRASEDAALPATLILGHGAYLEAWEDYLLWAARAGYSSVFIRTTPDALALGAAPQLLYATLRPAIAALARRLGLSLELGGRCLPSLFWVNEDRRDPCPSSNADLAILSEAFGAWAAGHPEISLFHAWPEDRPESLRCSCPACAVLSPAARSLRVSRALAAALARSRPDAALSFLAGHDAEDLAAAIGGEALPPRLQLAWAPRRRSWGAALGDASNTLNAASLAAFRKTARAWREAGGGDVAVYERWEDALLFKGAVPPLAAVIEGDLAAYRGGGRGDPREAADSVGVLCAGGRLPLGPRPNAWILPRIAAAQAAMPSSAPRSGALMADWSLAAYGASASPMLEYWAELEAAWAIDLDVEEGETSINMPAAPSRYAADPPADWGDPWPSGAERLAARRGRCEELFDHLRRAEAKLSVAQAAAEGAADTDGAAAAAVRGEAAEYAVSGALLELDCARLAAYHELAGGDARAAADIANLALSVSAAVRVALRALPDRRARREISFIVGLFYDLRLRAIRRANARSGLRRLLDLWYTRARTALAALPLPRAYEPKQASGTSPARRGIASGPRTR